MVGWAGGVVGEAEGKGGEEEDFGCGFVRDKLHGWNLLVEKGAIADQRFDPIRRSVGGSVDDVDISVC